MRCGAVESVRRWRGRVICLQLGPSAKQLSIQASPWQKWDALGHSIEALAPAAAAAGVAASAILYNWEARTAATAGGPKLRACRYGSTSNVEDATCLALQQCIGTFL